MLCNRDDNPGEESASYKGNGGGGGDDDDFYDTRMTNWDGCVYLCYFMRMRNQDLGI